MLSTWISGFLQRAAPDENYQNLVELSTSYGIAWNECNHHEKLVLWFLFDRKVHKALEGDAQGDKNESVGNRLREAMDETLEVGQRASVILYQRGQTFSKTVPDEVQSYEQFLEKCPVWRGGQSETDGNQPGTKWDEIIINFLEGLSALKVSQAAQLSNTCYFHGPVSVYQYLRQWHQNDNDKSGNRLIDIPRYMRHAFHQGDLKTHLFDEKGGRSENIFKKLVKEGTKEEEADKGEYNLCSMIVRYEC